MRRLEVTSDLTMESILQQMNGERLVLTRHGHAVALLEDFDDDDLEMYDIEHDPEFIASIREGRQQAAQGKTISHEELKKRLGID